MTGRHDINSPDTGPASSRAPGPTGAEGYREALEDYAELLGAAGDDPAAMRRLEKTIADHLVDGAAPAAVEPAPTPTGSPTGAPIDMGPPNEPPRDH